MQTKIWIILFILFNCLIRICPAQQAEDEKLIFRITGIDESDAIRLEKAGIRLLWHDRLPEAQAFLTDMQVNWLIKSGFEVTVLSQAGEKVDPEYHSYEELYAYIDSLRSIYPDIMSVDTLGYSHVMQLPIPMVKISDNAATDEDEVVIWYDGMHHAREPVGMETCIKIMDHLLLNYLSDPQVQKWVDNAEIYIVPCLNPDGWKYVIDSALNYPWWRKNLHDNNANGKFDPDFDGTDLNRNYNYAWEYGDTVTTSETYQGPFPFSEAETCSKRDFMLSQKPVVSITYHSYGEYVCYVKYIKYTDAPDWPVMYLIADHVADMIPKINGGNYTTGTIAGLEPQSPNWCYQTAGTLEILIETADVFIPTGQTGQQVATDNLPGALYLLERAFKSGITGHAWDAETGEPLPATIEIVGIDNELIEPRTCDSLYGRYTRLLLPGNYTVRAYTENTDPITVSNVAVIEDTLTVLDFELTRPVGVDELAVVSRQSSVVSCYPNPTGGSLQFAVRSSQEQIVSLKIYDLHGREVAVVVDGQIAAGEHVITWNAQNLPAGIFYYRLTTEDCRLTTGTGKLVKY